MGLEEINADFVSSSENSERILNNLQLGKEMADFLS
jgi:hypothetical protein